jgi:hypothetical protein
VLALRASTRRRVFNATLSVHRLPAGIGDPTRTGGCPESAAAVGPAVAAWKAPVTGTSGWDWHLRRELLSRLLEQAEQRVVASGTTAEPVLLVWTRPGATELEDADAAWWAAAHSAGSDIGAHPLGLAVVTRWGWWMLPEGPARRWQRLRAHHVRRSPNAGAPLQLGADGQSSGQV